MSECKHGVFLYDNCQRCVDEANSAVVRQTTTPQLNKLTAEELQSIREHTDLLTEVDWDRILDHIAAQENELKQYIRLSQDVAEAKLEREQLLKEMFELREELTQCQRELSDLQLTSNAEAEIRKQLVEERDKCRSELEQTREVMRSNCEIGDKLTKERDQLQRQIEELRDALLVAGSDGTDRPEAWSLFAAGSPSEALHARMKFCREKALSIDAGKGWVRVGDIEKAIEGPVEGLDLMRGDAPIDMLIARLQTLIDHANSPVTHNPEEDEFFKQYNKEQK